MNFLQEFNNLNKLFDSAPEINIEDNDKIIIFSDLHIGNGNSRDEFTRNARLFKYILQHYYLKKDYTLFLNGDVEDLYKFSITDIVNAWSDIYSVLEEFDFRNKLYKMEGNHDFEIRKTAYPPINKNVLPAVKLKYKDNYIFIYHGHQTDRYLFRYNPLSRFCVRYSSMLLRIKNGSISIDNKKKFKTEVISYDFAADKKIISILGHTHRPLFESLSKIDDLTFKIENLIRKYPLSDDKERSKIETLLKKYKTELQHLHDNNKEYNLRSSIYDEKLLVPCLFNSGAVIGKRGITGIEIKNGNISLIYWFDKFRSHRYMKYQGVDLKRLNKSDFYKAILKEDSLDYIFTRIKLLA